MAPGFLVGGPTNDASTAATGTDGRPPLMGGAAFMTDHVQKARPMTPAQGRARGVQWYRLTPDRTPAAAFNTKQGRFGMRHIVPHSKPTRLVDWLKSLALLISLALALIWTMIFIVIWAMSTATS